MKSQRLTSFLRSGAIAAAFALSVILLQSSPASASSEGGFQRTLTVNGTVDLDVNTGSGDVRITSGDSGKVEITARIRSNRWLGGNDDARIHEIESNPPIQQNGNTIRIGHLDNELGHNISISYQLRVPSDTRLHAHTGSGDQEIAGINGPIEVETGSGDLRVSNIGNTVRAETGSGDVEIRQVKGDLHTKTGSGTVHAEDIAGAFEGHSGSGSVDLSQTAPGRVQVTTGSGDIELRGVNGALEAEAGSGGIRVEGKPSGSWNVKTGSGEVELRLVADAAFDLDAHTSSGSISVDMPMMVQGSIGRKEVHGKVRGGGIPMEIRTGSGDIDIH